MSGSSPTPPADNKDTEGVNGQTGPASAGTASRASTTDTSTTGGGSRATEPKSPAVTQTDTTGANGGATTAPTNTGLSGTPDTRGSGLPTGGQANPVYRAPSGPVPASVRDTTLTDKQPGGSATSPVPTTYNQNATTETANIGAGPAASGVVPAAPTGVAATTGPRSVTVTWTAPANPAGDPVLGFAVVNSAGGTMRVGKSATSAVVTNLDPSRTYTFQVLARNASGNGPLSAPSAAVRPYNPDEADVNRPGGLNPANTVNPIYSPDGSIKPGTGLGH